MFLTHDSSAKHANQAANQTNKSYWRHFWRPSQLARSCSPRWSPWWSLPRSFVKRLPFRRRRCWSRSRSSRRSQRSRQKARESHRILYVFCPPVFHTGSSEFSVSYENNLDVCSTSTVQISPRPWVYIMDEIGLDYSTFFCALFWQAGYFLSVFLVVSFGKLTCSWTLWQAAWLWPQMILNSLPGVQGLISMTLSKRSLLSSLESFDKEFWLQETMALDLEDWYSLMCRTHFVVLTISLVMSRNTKREMVQRQDPGFCRSCSVICQGDILHDSSNNVVQTWSIFL